MSFPQEKQNIGRSLTTLREKEKTTKQTQSNEKNETQSNDGAKKEANMNHISKTDEST